MPLELLDIILIILVLISGFLAMVRGFSREILSISSWIVAILAAITFYEVFTPYAAEYTVAFTSNELVPRIVSGAIIFVIALILVSLITLKIADFIVDSRVGALDRTLGFIFGAARGVLLVTVLLMFYLNFFPDNQPNWVANAKSKPMLESIGESLVNVLPENPGEFLSDQLDLDGESDGDGQES